MLSDNVRRRSSGGVLKRSGILIVIKLPSYGMMEKQ